MKAGRELDALIAEKVMGLTRHDESYVAEGVGKVLRFVCGDGCGTCVLLWGYVSPHYSTNIADAWEVVTVQGHPWLDGADVGAHLAIRSSFTPMAHETGECLC